jgi:hypothetical protein
LSSISIDDSSEPNPSPQISPQVTAGDIMCMSSRSDIPHS